MNAWRKGLSSQETLLSIVTFCALITFMEPEKFYFKPLVLKKESRSL